MNGGCLCGNIRFSATGDPDFPDLCSCEHCQRLSGAPVMSWVSFPEEDFAWTGPGGESFARRGTSAHSRRRYPIWRSVVTAILSSGACSRKTRCVSMRPPSGQAPHCVCPAADRGDHPACALPPTHDNPAVGRRGISHPSLSSWDVCSSSFLTDVGA
ncbi:GFA family protein [Nocardia fluminea]